MLFLPPRSDYYRAGRSRGGELGSGEGADLDAGQGVELGRGRELRRYENRRGQHPRPISGLRVRV